jgi:hypothetical protein
VPQDESTVISAKNAPLAAAANLFSNSAASISVCVCCACWSIASPARRCPIGSTVVPAVSAFFLSCETPPVGFLEAHLQGRVRTSGFVLSLGQPHGNDRLRVQGIPYRIFNDPKARRSVQTRGAVCRIGSGATARPSETATLSRQGKARRGPDRNRSRLPSRQKGRQFRRVSE